jgi:hypothetical protein
MLLNKSPPVIGVATPNRVGVPDCGKNQHANAARGGERYRSTDRPAKGRILDELCATMGWHPKHAVRALRQHEPVTEEAVEAPRERKRRYGATIKDALNTGSMVDAGRHLFGATAF